MRLLPYGGHAVLVELADLDETLAYVAAVRSAGLPDVVDVVPAERTVLVTTAGDLAGLRLRLSSLDPAGAPAVPVEGEVVELPVRYDGDDLDDVARLTGMSRAEVVRAHTATPWRVAFGGFVPGFAYLVGGDERLQVPRRDNPRARVPAGSVGLAGSYSGVYPRESPGGWQLIGRTDAVLWDPDRDPPALLGPGARVRFVPAAGDPPLDRGGPGAHLLDRGHPEPTRVGTRATQPATQPSERGEEPALEVVAAGPRTLVQDLGRARLAHLGVSRSGAADRGAHALAQRLVANDEGAAGLEVVLGGLRLRAHRDLLIVVTGAPVPVTVDARPVALAAPVALSAGQELRLGTPPSGLRSYVAVRGGLAVAPVLGSCSTDVLTGLGPEEVRDGDLLGIGGPPPEWPLVDAAPYAAPYAAPDTEHANGVVTLTASPGPRLDRLVDEAPLWAQRWRVAADSDRVGLRLEGEPLPTADEPLASEGLLPGAVQVPPGGQPVLFLADHPVTGGYPVVAVVRDVDALAQLRPGQSVRFVAAG